MNYTKELRKAVKMEILQRRNRIFAHNPITSHTDNVINHTEQIIPNDDGDILTERQRYIADKLIESRHYKGCALFDDDYNHLCRNLFAQIVMIDSIEVVAVKHTFGFRFSFIEKKVSTQLTNY